MSFFHYLLLTTEQNIETIDHVESKLKEVTKILSHKRFEFPFIANEKNMETFDNFANKL